MQAAEQRLLAVARRTPEEDSERRRCEVGMM